jgi:NAD(P)-dependent dehydrogenase (short-subunit alcohol dehydrogenase family)
MATRKIVLITGANTGIGLEAVKAMLKSSQAYHIIAGSRSVEKGDAAISKLKTELASSASTVEVIQVDIHSDDSINKAFEIVKAKHEFIDVIVNNAGELPSSSTSLTSTLPFPSPKSPPPFTPPRVRMHDLN